MYILYTTYVFWCSRLKGHCISLFDNRKETVQQAFLLPFLCPFLGIQKISGFGFKFVEIIVISFDTPESKHFPYHLVPRVKILCIVYSSELLQPLQNIWQKLGILFLAEISCSSIVKVER